MADKNPNSRLEAFCDGVFAIAITLLVIDIRIPPTAEVESTTDLWRQLMHLVPAVLAFVLSFSVILITWVNHHAALKLIDKSSPAFIYANGFLLLTVAFIPFPTALLGEYVVSDHASPVVILYDAVLAVQAAAWVLVCKAVLANDLARDAKAAETIRMNGRYGYFAFALYSLFAIAALWSPLAVAGITAATWIFWLVLGIRMRSE
jgi:uncharacterized membrane protein